MRVRGLSTLDLAELLLRTMHAERRCIRIRLPNTGSPPSTKGRTSVWFHDKGPVDGTGLPAGAMPLSLPGYWADEHRCLDQLQPIGHHVRGQRILELHALSLNFYA